MAYSKSAQCFLFAGVYTSGNINTGIYVYRFDVGTGALLKVAEANNLVNASFLSLSPNGKYLYACTDTKLDTDGSISAYRINRSTGQLTFLNKQLAGGRNPVYVGVHPEGNYVVSCNYTDGGIAIYSCLKDGSLSKFRHYLPFEEGSIIKGRQDEGHVHSVVFSADGRFLFSPDLGADKIRVFRFSPFKTHLLEPMENLTIASFPGSGPRHFIFHPNNKFAYCIEELSGMVAAYAYQEGLLTPIDRKFSYSQEQVEYGSADIHIAPDGKFIYASNRLNNENTLSIFAINASDGTLKLVGHQSTFGDHPRSFVIDPSGNYLLVANQDAGNIVVFKRSLKTGLLEKTDIEIKLKLPASLKMICYG
jgi:6-phosphogluconolactonase (cycloisomerase 2 family)